MRSGDANNCAAGIIVAMPLCTALLSWRGFWVVPITSTPPLADWASVASGRPNRLKAPACRIWRRSGWVMDKLLDDKGAPTGCRLGLQHEARPRRPQ